MLDVMEARRRRIRLGEGIRSARRRLDWSQERFVEELNKELAEWDGSTVTQGAVSRWENGSAVPRRDKLPVIESVLGLEAGDLRRVLEPDLVVKTSDGDEVAIALDFNSKVARLDDDDRRYVEELIDRLLGDT